MIIERDLGIGVTIDIDNVPLSKKYTVAALLAVAICTYFPTAVAALIVVFFAVENDSQ